MAVIKTTQTASVLSPIIVNYYINGVLRTDCETDTIEFSTEETSSILLKFPQSGYDDVMMREGDLLEIGIKPRGILWRGYCVGRNSNVSGELYYLCLDYSNKLNSETFFESYNYRENSFETRNLQTIQGLVQDAQSLYNTWWANITPDDYLLTFDIESFPTTYFGSLDLTGVGLLDGIKNALNKVYKNKKVVVEHTNSISMIRCVTLGEGDIKKIVRGDDIRFDYTDQRYGVVNAIKVDLEYNSADTFSHIYGLGSNREIETSLGFSQHWDEVADEDVPPDYLPDGISSTGDVIIPHTFALTVLENYEAYTTPSFDYNGKAIANHLYRPEYEKIYKEFEIDRRDDLWHWNDDDTQAVGGETNRSMPISSDMVRPETDKPFVVFRREGSEEYETKVDGFSIEGNLLKFNEPFYERKTYLVLKDTCRMHYDISNDRTVCAVKKAQDQDLIDDFESLPILNNWTNLTPTLDLTELIPDVTGLYVCFGKWPYPVPLQSVDATNFYVAESFVDLREGTAPVTAGEAEAGIDEDFDFFITNQNPVVASGSSGSGGILGLYSCLAGDGIKDAYVGHFLVMKIVHALGYTDVNASKQFCYKILHNDEDYLYVGQDVDLTTAPHEWTIIDPSLDTAVPFAEMFLNATAVSTQPLIYSSGNTNTVVDKKALVKVNSDFVWRTQWNNWILKSEPNTADFNSPKHTVEFNAGNTEQIEYDEDNLYRKDGNINETLYSYRDTETGEILTPKDIEELDDTAPPLFYNSGGLKTWSDKILASQNQPVVKYSIISMWDLSYKLGDVISDNDINYSTTIVKINFDLNNFTVGIDAEYRGGE